MDIVVWLRGLGLGKYEAAFRENEIDETVLPSLTAEDLKDVGVGLVGHRRKLLDAIAALRAEARGPARDHFGVSNVRRRYRAPLRGFCRQIHGRWRAHLFRLSAGARARGRAG